MDDYNFGGKKPLIGKKGQNRFQNFPEIFPKIRLFNGSIYISLWVMYIRFMAYVILKNSPDNPHVIIVNDSEGIPMEFDTYEGAKKLADLFQANTTHNSTYEVKEIS